MEFCQHAEGAMWQQAFFACGVLMAWLSLLENPQHPDLGKRKGSSKGGFVVLLFASLAVIFITGIVMAGWER